MSLRILVIATAIAMLSAGCGGDEEPSRSAAPQDEPSFPPAMSPYEPAIDPADFVEGIDNPYLPFEPGTEYIYEVVTEGEHERDVITVTNKTKEIMGVTCTVVRDVESVKGKLAEKTFDWYAQDRYGNVWYFGEYSEAYEDGKVSTEGSWEAGVDGALPGIIMLGDPQIGDRYRQEYFAGEAEDIGEVVKLDASIEVPFGSFTDLIVIEEWNPLEPKIYEDDYYAEGVGLVFEEVTRGASEVVKLVKVTRG
jgi:hypothetical protein